MFTWEKRAFEWTQRVIASFRGAIADSCRNQTDDELRAILTFLIKEQGLDLFVKDMQHQIDDQFNLIRRQRDHIEKLDIQYKKLLSLMSETIESEYRRPERKSGKTKSADVKLELPSNVIEFKRQ